MMYFVGVPSLHQKTDAFTCAFGYFPGASHAGEQTFPDRPQACSVDLYK